MKTNIFEMGANFDDAWTADNKSKPNRKIPTEIKLPQKHQLHLAKEKRRGKIVTIAKPFYLEKVQIKELLKTLKKKLGTGGTIRDDSLEFQGDIAETLRTQLEILNYRFKR